jgi:CDP-diacylglycerol---serine O-phosphatidyltransferase
VSQKRIALTQIPNIIYLSGMKQIPNLFTLLNLIFGCLAIIFTLQTGEKILLLQPEGLTEISLPEKITWASFCIFGSAVVDFLDGFIARLFKAESAMGKQLDSLADVVSFGVAPGLILYQLLRISYAQQENGLDVSMAWLFPAFLIPCAAAWRLARFNIDQSQQYSFSGLPTPAAGLAIASLPLVIWFQSLGLQQYLVNKWVLYSIILVFSWLMVSSIRVFALKFRDFSWQHNLPKYLLLILAVIAIVVLQWAALPFIVLAYVVLSLLFKNKAV